MGNKFKRLIMFLIIVLGIGLFANEEKKAPNEIIKDNPDRKVTTVESMKVRDHATMSLTVTKVNKPELQGKLKYGVLEITLPKKDTKAKISNRMKQEEIKRKIKVEKISDRPQMLRAAVAPLVPNRPTQEQMDNLTPEQIREMLANPPKPEEVVTSGESKDLRASEVGENIYVNVFDVDKSDKLILKVEENGVVVEEYPVVISSIEKSTTKSPIYLQNSYFTDIVGTHYASSLKLMDMNKTVTTGYGNESSAIKEVKLSEINLTKLVFDDYFLGERVINIDPGTANSKEGVGFAFKLKYLGAQVNNPIERHNQYPVVGPDTLIKTSGEIYSSLKSDPSVSSGMKSYQNYQTSNFYSVQNKSGVERNVFKNLQVLERDNYGSVYSPHLTGGITDVSFDVEVNAKGGAFPGVYKTVDGQSIEASYLRNNDSVYFKAIAQNLKVNIGDTDVTNTNGVIPENETQKISFSVGGKVDPGKWYEFENVDADSSLSFMQETHSDDIGLFIAEDNGSYTPMVRYNLDPNANYYTRTSEQNGKTQRFVIGISQEKGDWARVRIKPNGLQNPSESVSDKPKISFTIVQGVRKDGKIIELRKVKYSIEFNRVDYYQGDVVTKIDRRVEQYTQNNRARQFYTLNGKAINESGNVVADLSGFFNTTNFQTDMNITEIKKVERVISDTQTDLYLEQTNPIGTYKNYRGLVIAKAGGNLNDLANNQNIGMKESEFQDKLTRKITFNGAYSFGVKGDKVLLSGDDNFTYSDGYETTLGSIDITGKSNQRYNVEFGDPATSSGTTIKVSQSGHMPNYKSLVKDRDIATHYRVNVGGTTSSFIQIGNEVSLPGYTDSYDIKLKRPGNGSTNYIEINKKRDTQINSNVRIDYYYHILNTDVQIKLGSISFILVNNKDLPIEDLGRITTEMDPRFKQLYATTNNPAQYRDFYITLDNYAGESSVVGELTGFTLRDTFIKTSGGLKQKTIIFDQPAYDNNYNPINSIIDGREAVISFEGPYSDKTIKIGNNDIVMLTSIMNGESLGYTPNWESDPNKTKYNSDYLFKEGYYKRKISETTLGEAKIIYVYHVGNSLLPGAFYHTIKELGGNSYFTWDKGHIGSGDIDFTGKAKTDNYTVGGSGEFGISVSNLLGKVPTLSGLVTGKTNEVIATHFTVKELNEDGTTKQNYGEQALGAAISIGSDYSITINGQLNNNFIIRKITDETINKKLLIEYYRDLTSKKIKLGEFTLNLTNTKAVEEMTGKFTTTLDPRIYQKSGDTNWITLDGSIFSALVSPNITGKYSKFVKNENNLYNRHLSETLRVVKDRKEYVDFGTVGSIYDKFGIDRQAGSDTIAIKREIGITVNSITNGNFAVKYFDQGDFKIDFRAANGNHYSFNYTLTERREDNNFSTKNGYVGSGSVNFTGKSNVEYILGKTATTDTELAIEGLNGWLPTFATTVKNEIAVGWYRVTVNDGTPKGANIDTEIELNNSYNILLTKNGKTTEASTDAKKYIKITKKNDATVSMKVVIEYYTEEDGIKLGEFTLNVSNTESVTDLGRIITEIDPRFKQVTNYNTYWIKSNGSGTTALNGSASEYDFSDIIGSTTLLNGSATISSIQEVKDANNQEYPSANSVVDGYTKFNNPQGGDSYGVKLNNSIGSNSLRDTFARKYNSRDTLITKFTDSTGTTVEVYKVEYDFVEINTGINNFEIEGYQVTQDVDISKLPVHEKYTFTSGVTDETNKKIHIGRTPNLNGIVSGKTDISIADIYVINGQEYTVGNGEVDVLNNKLKIKLLSTGEIEITKNRDEEIVAENITISYYMKINGLSTTGNNGKIKLGTYTLRVTNSNPSENMGTITTTVDPRLNQTNMSMDSYWIATNNRIGKGLSDLGIDFSKFIKNTRDSDNNRTIAKVLEIKDSKNTNDYTSNTVEGDYTPFGKKNSDSVYAIKLGKNFTNNFDTGFIARKYTKEVNNNMEITYHGADDAKTKVDFNHVIVKAQAPADHFSETDGYTGSGTVNFTGKELGKYTLTTGATETNSITVEHPVGHLPNLKSLVIPDRVIATHYTVTEDTGVTRVTNKTPIATETDILEGSFSLKFDNGDTVIEKKNKSSVSNKVIRIDYYYVDEANSIEIKLGNYQLTINNMDSAELLGTISTKIDPRLGQLTDYWLENSTSVYNITNSKKISLVDFIVYDDSEIVDTENFDIEKGKVTSIDIDGTEYTNPQADGDYNVYNSTFAVKNGKIKDQGTFLRKFSPEGNITVEFNSNSGAHAFISRLLSLLSTGNNFQVDNGYIGRGTVDFTNKPTGEYTLKAGHILEATQPSTTTINLTNTDGYIPKVKSLVNTGTTVATHYKVTVGNNGTPEEKELVDTNGVNVGNNYSVKFSGDNLVVNKKNNDTISDTQVKIEYYYKNTANGNNISIKLGEYTLTIKNIKEIDMGTVILNIDKRLLQVSPITHNWLKLNGNLGRIHDKIGNYSELISKEGEFKNVTTTDTIRKVVSINDEKRDYFPTSGGYIYLPSAGNNEAAVPQSNTMEVYAGDLSTLIVSKYLANEDTHTGENKFVIEATNTSGEKFFYKGNLQENYTDINKSNNVVVKENDTVGYTGSGELNIAGAVIGSIYSFPAGTSGNIASDNTEGLILKTINSTKSLDARGIFTGNNKKNIANKMEVIIGGVTTSIKGKVGEPIVTDILDGKVNIGIDKAGRLRVKKLLEENIPETEIEIKYYYDDPGNTSTSPSNYAVHLGTFTLAIKNPVETLNVVKNVKIDNRLQGSNYKWVSADGMARETLGGTTVNFSKLVKFENDYNKTVTVKKVLGMEGRTLNEASSTNEYQVYDRNGVDYAAMPIPHTNGELLSEYENRLIVSLDTISPDNNFSILVEERGEEKVLKGNITENVYLGQNIYGSGEIVFLDNNVGKDYAFGVTHSNNEATVTVDGTTLTIRNIQGNLPNGNSLTEVIGSAEKIANKILVTSDGSTATNLGVSQELDNINFSINNQGGLTLRKVNNAAIDNDKTYTIKFYYSDQGEDIELATFDLTVKASNKNIGSVTVNVDGRLLPIANSWITLDGKVKDFYGLTNNTFANYEKFISITGKFDDTQYEQGDTIERVVTLNNVIPGKYGIYAFNGGFNEAAIPYEGLNMGQFSNLGEGTKLVVSKWNRTDGSHTGANTFVLEARKADGSFVYYKGDLIENFRADAPYSGEGSLDITAAILGKEYSFAPGAESDIISEELTLSISDGKSPDATSILYATSESLATKMKITVDGNSSTVIKSGDKLKREILSNTVELGISNNGGLTVKKIKNLENSITDKEITIEYYYSPNTNSNITQGVDVHLGTFTLSLTNTIKDIGTFNMNIDSRLVQQKEGFWYLANGMISSGITKDPAGDKNYELMIEGSGLNLTNIPSNEEPSDVDVIGYTKIIEEKGWVNDKTYGRVAFAQRGGYVLLTLPKKTQMSQYSDWLAVNLSYSEGGPRNPYTFILTLLNEGYKGVFNAASGDQEKIESSATLDLGKLHKGSAYTWDSESTGTTVDGENLMTFSPASDSTPGKLFNMGSYGGKQITNKFTYKVGDNGTEQNINTTTRDIDLNGNGTLDIRVSFVEEGLQITKLTNEATQSTTLTITPKYNDVVLGTLNLTVSNDIEDLGNIALKIDKRLAQVTATDWLGVDGKLYNSTGVYGNYSNFIGKVNSITTTINNEDISNYKVIDIESIESQTNLKSYVGTRANYKYLSVDKNELALPLTLSSGGTPVTLANYDINGQNPLVVISKKDIATTTRNQGTTDVSATNEFILTARTNGTQSEDKLYTGSITETYVGAGAYSGEGTIDLVDSVSGRTYTFATTTTSNTITGTGDNGGGTLTITNVIGTPVNTLGLVGDKAGKNIANKLEVQFINYNSDTVAHKDTIIINETTSSIKYNNLAIGVNTAETNGGGLTLKRDGSSGVREAVISYYYDPVSDSKDLSNKKVLLGTFTLTIKNVLELGEVTVDVDSRLTQVSLANHNWIRLGNGKVSNLKGDVSAGEYPLFIKPSGDFSLGSNTIFNDYTISSITKINGITSINSIGDSESITYYYTNNNGAKNEAAYPINIPLSTFIKTDTDSKLVISKYSYGDTAHTKENDFIATAQKDTKAINIKGNILETYNTPNVRNGYTGEGSINLVRAELGNAYTFEPQKATTTPSRTTTTSDVVLSMTSGTSVNAKGLVESKDNSIANLMEITVTGGTSNPIRVPGTVGTTFEATGIKVGEAEITLGITEDGGFKIAKTKEGNIDNKSVIIDYYFSSNPSDENATKVKLGTFTLTINNHVIDGGEAEVQIDERFANFERYNWLFKEGQTANDMTTDKIDKSKAFNDFFKYTKQLNVIGTTGTITEALRVEGRKYRNYGIGESLNKPYVSFNIESNNWRGEAAVPRTGNIANINNLMVASKGNVSLDDKTSLNNKFALVFTDTNDSNIEKIYTGNIKETIIKAPVYSGSGKVNILKTNKDTAYKFATTSLYGNIGSDNDLTITNVTGTPVNTLGVVDGTKDKVVANRIQVTFRNGTTQNEVKKSTSPDDLSVSYGNLTIGITTVGDNNKGGLSLTRTSTNAEDINIKEAVIEYFYDADLTDEMIFDGNTADTIKLGEFNLAIEKPEFAIVGNNVLDFGTMIPGHTRTIGGNIDITNPANKNITFEVEPTEVMTLNGEHLSKPGHSTDGIPENEKLHIRKIWVQKRDNYEFYISATAEPHNTIEKGEYRGEIEVTVTITDSN